MISDPEVSGGLTSLGRVAAAVALMATIALTTCSLPTASQLAAFLQSAGCANAMYLKSENLGGAPTADIETGCTTRRDSIRGSER